MSSQSPGRPIRRDHKSIRTILGSLKVGESILFEEYERTPQLSGHIASVYRYFARWQIRRRYLSRVEHCLIEGYVRGVRVTRVL